MTYRTTLRPDLQVLLDQFAEMHDKFAALKVFSEKQQQSLELEREKSDKMRESLKNMTHWLMKREDWYKESLGDLEKKNKELQQVLVDTQHKHDHVEHLNEVKISKLQKEIDRLRAQVIHLDDKHKEELKLQDIDYKDQVSKYKNLLEMTKTTLSSKQDIARIETLKITEKHPAFINDKSSRKTESSFKKLQGLEVNKVNKTVPKRRKLFQEDKEATIDIV